jgi:hypothetical protein
MAHPVLARPSRLLALAVIIAGPMALAAVVACGGGAPPPAVPANASASAAASASSPGAAASASAAPSASAPAVPTETASAAPVAPPPVPTSAVATVKTDATWAACHQSFKAKNKDVAKDATAMAKACEGPTKMKLLGKVMTGKQADQDKPQSFPFEAKAHHCYRAYAQAAEGIKDLDVIIKDSADVIVGQDSTDDSSPVVNEDGAVCFSKDDKASVVVSVGMGSGAYAVQIAGD